MGNFQASYQVVMAIEGGYVNDPKDRGGETYKGVARKMWPSWLGWLIVDAARHQGNFPKSLDQNKVLEASVVVFYRENFWNANRLGEVADNNISLELFDISVNMGIGIAAEMLQRALNLLNRGQSDYPDLRIDKKIGTDTLKTLNNHKNPRMVYDVLNTLQGCRYIEIATANPSQERFLNGWLTRVYK